MILLYCINGVVRAQHDSTQPPVSPDSYDASTRVIPYDPETMGRLDRVGDPPADLLHDTRPYAEPAETPLILKGYASQMRYSVVTAGISWKSMQIKTDRTSQLMLGNLAVYAGTLNPNDIVDFTQDSTSYQFPASDAIDLNKTVNAFIQQCRTTEAQCLADLNSATPTILTYEDVEAKFAGLKAKTIGLVTHGRSIVL